LPVSFEEVGDIALAIGRAEQAARLYGAAEIQRVLQATPLETAWHAEHERKINAVRNALSLVDFAAAWAAGRSLTLDEAVAEALAIQVNPPSAPAGASASLLEPTAPRHLDRRSVADLSPREREILRRIADGQTNQEIAADLNLSIRTVNNHVTDILEKLGQPSRAAAVAVAIRHGLI
jgi:DNA-binding NarL/FixJ family response regulator